LADGQADGSRDTSEGEVDFAFITFERADCEKEG